jgi:hypothetical protein
LGGGWRNGCHTARLDVGGPAPTDEQRFGLQRVGGAPDAGIGEAGVIDKWGPSDCYGGRGQTRLQSNQIQMVQFNSNTSKL